MLVPSATQGYLDSKNNWTPYMSNQEIDIQLWYKCRTDELVHTKYALPSRPKYTPFIGVAEYSSTVIGQSYLSISQRIRQPNLNDMQNPNISWTDITQFLSHTNISLSQFVQHLGRMPIHPSINMLLIIYWLMNDDYQTINEYLQGLKWNSAQYMTAIHARPLYLRFFLLTRGYDFPLLNEENQLLKMYTPDKSPLSRYIANILLVENLDYNKVLSLAKLISTGDTNQILDTPYSEWVDYASEYLQFYESPPQTSNNLYDQLGYATDNQLLSLQLDMNLEFPPLTNFPTRQAWVFDIANLIRTQHVPNLKLTLTPDMLVST